MSYRQPNYFTGLYTEQYYSQRKVYGVTFDVESVNSGVVLCGHDANITHPEPYFTECPVPGTPAVDIDIGGAPVDLLDAAVHVDFVNETTQTLEERSVLDPPPDFVQVFVSGNARTTGGNGDCPPPGVIEDCLDPIDGDLVIDVGSSFGAEYPFGISNIELDRTGTPTLIHYPEASIPAPGGSIFKDMAGLLRRPLDGLSWDGEPDNEAVDTLIPWEVFKGGELNEAIVSLDFIGAGVWRLSAGQRVVNVIPWYRIDQLPTSATFMCVL